MHFTSRLARGVLVALAVCGCRVAARTARGTTIEQRSFGRTRDGVDTKIYTLTNANGLVAKVTDYGATLTELWLPDRNGKLGDVVLGYERLEDYEAAPFYLGAVLGRVANRIANGKFTLDGRSYSLATNRAPNHLHGGIRGFDKRVWTGAVHGAAVTFAYTRVDGEEGYPGKLRVKVTHRLTDASVPTGEIASVIGGPLDFTRPRKIGERIEEMRAVASERQRSSARWRLGAACKTSPRSSIHFAKDPCAKWEDNPSFLPA